MFEKAALDSGFFYGCRIVDQLIDRRSIFAMFNRHISCFVRDDVSDHDLG
jgi:hypothetical protein